MVLQRHPEFDIASAHVSRNKLGQLRKLLLLLCSSQGDKQFNIEDLLAGQSLSSSSSFSFSSSSTVEMVAGTALQCSIGGFEGEAVRHAAGLHRLPPPSRHPGAHQTSPHQGVSPPPSAFLTSSKPT